MRERQSAPSVRKFAREDPEPADSAFEAKQAANLANENCDRAMALAHKLTAQLREAQNRINQLEIDADGLVDRLRADAETAVAKLQSDADARVDRTKREADKQVARLESEAENSRRSLAGRARTRQAGRRPGEGRGRCAHRGDQDRGG